MAVRKAKGTSSAKSGSVQPATKPRKKPRPRKTSEPKPIQDSPAEQLHVIALRDRIQDLAAAGASVRQIAEQLQREGVQGASKSNVHKHLQAGIEEARKELKLKTSEHVYLELEKLQRVEVAHLSRLIKATNADDIDKIGRTIERVWNRRDKLLGLAKPVKVSVNAQEILAKLLGRSPEELPSGDVES